MASAASWSTRANALTLVRLLLVPAIAGAILQGMTPLAAWLLALAIATDFADGWVARRYGEESAFGGFADHAVDALLVTAGTAAHACTGVVPAPLPWLIALAFTQYALDSRIVAGHALRASALGRWNGIAYYVVLAVPLARDALALSWPDDAFVRQLGWLLVASTGVSMGDRLLTYWRRGD